ncbi:hypothetical protein EVAR_41517_1 [Eumeta japonica]|uniref:Uncharacterized protein n=1 Tax=Eumeta variegata TaxID=151549 RepID=A0A4C1X2A8_EUMVA|nr:hypothetical protein EVAR_41517_1 [Eumeta japonica]
MYHLTQITIFQRSSTTATTAARAATTSIWEIDGTTSGVAVCAGSRTGSGLTALQESGRDTTTNGRGPTCTEDLVKVAGHRCP